MHDKTFRIALHLQQRLLSTLHHTVSIEWSRPVARFVRRFALLRLTPEVGVTMLVSLAAQIRSLVVRRNHVAVPEWCDEALRAPSHDELVRRFERYVLDLLAPRQPAPRNGAVEVATKFIETNFADQITTASVARLVGRERTYFATAFRRQTGQTIHRYVVSVRLRHAVSRLAEGEKVESAMLSAGYRSKRSFYRDFRAQLGATPGTFRDTLRR